MRRITLFIVTLFFCIGYTFAQQIYINLKNGQRIIYNASDIKNVDFSVPLPDYLPKVLIGAIVLTSDPTDPTDLQTVLTDEVISDAIQKGKDSNGTMYLREKKLSDVIYPKYVSDEPTTTRHYGLVMIPNIEEFAQYEGGFIDLFGGVYRDMSFITYKPENVFYGSILKYNGTEYRVYGEYDPKIGGIRDWTVHIK